MIAEAIEVTVQQVPTGAIFHAPNSADLIRAYSKECLVPEAEPQPEMYAAMERAGMLKCFAAYIDGVLVGVCSVITSVVPHGGWPVATIESLFVDPLYRSTSAFEDLLAAAEQYAKDSGCSVFSCLPRIDSALDKVLSRRSGFARTHVQHTKWLRGERPC